MKKILLAILAVLPILAAKAQQDPLFFQYRQNAAIINPAFSGAEGISFISLASRWQWIGIKGAPHTYVFSGNFRLPKGFGMGFQTVADLIGPSQQYRANLDLAYHIPLGRNIRLSAGFRGTAGFTQVNLAELSVNDPNDPAYFQNLFSGFKFNLGGGLLLHSDHFFVGVSIPNALEFNVFQGNTQSPEARYTQIRHYFFTGGGNFSLHRDWVMRLSTLIRYSLHSSVQADINMGWDYKKKFQFGIMYRTFDAFGANLGFVVGGKFHLYYQYELPLTQLMQSTVQTHNLGLRFDLNAAKLKQIHSPRLFF